MSLTKISKLRTKSSPVPDILDLTLLVSFSTLLSLYQVMSGLGLAEHLHSITRFFPPPSCLTEGFSLNVGALPPGLPGCAPTTNKTFNISLTLGTHMLSYIEQRHYG